ncbi:hypothetical protein ACJX0J_031672, partial [Zea mays]
VAYEYDERDEVLYALAMGACNADAADEKELQLVYHRDGQSSIKVLPTFISALNAKTGDGFYMDVPGLHYNPTLLLHGQQYIEIYKPIPSRDNVANKIKLAGLHDRGILDCSVSSFPMAYLSFLCWNLTCFFFSSNLVYMHQTPSIVCNIYERNKQSPARISSTTSFSSTTSLLYEQ